MTARNAPGVVWLSALAWLALAAPGPAFAVVAAAQPSSDAPPSPTPAGEVGEIRSALGLGTSRVVGGSATAPGQFPFVASLRGADGENFCSGSLIHPNVVVTAAHCVQEPLAPDRRFPTVHVGQYRRDGAGEDSSIDVRSVATTVVHAGYNKTIHSFDIALLRLSAPVTRKAPVVRAKEATSLPEGTPLVVAGWGSTTESDYEPSDVLLAANVTSISKQKCGEKLRANALLPGMLCAGFIEGGQDSCEGDSGGPLLLSSSGEQVLVGLVSWGVGCARPGLPGVYTSLAYYSDWIDGWVERWAPAAPAAEQSEPSAEPLQF